MPLRQNSKDRQAVFSRSICRNCNASDANKKDLKGDGIAEDDADQSTPDAPESRIVPNHPCAFKRQPQFDVWYHKMKLGHQLRPILCPLRAISGHCSAQAHVRIVPEADSSQCDRHVRFIRKKTLDVR